MAVIDTDERVVLPDSWLFSRAVFEEMCHRSAGDSNFASACLFGKWWARMDPNDTSVCPHLMRDGYWESWVSLAVARAVQPGWRVVDCGSHVGWFTMLALARGAESVLAIEPQFELITLLNDTLMDNSLRHRVAMVCNAVGRESGTGTLLTYGGLTGSASLDAHAAEGWTPEGSRRVSVCTLDHLVNAVMGLERVDLIKVDVEGAEADVWAGMSETLVKNHDVVVVVEVGSPRGYDLEALLKRIQDDGFLLRAVNYEGMIRNVTESWVVENAKDLPNLWLKRGDL